jgi:hypothetical protein
MHVCIFAYNYLQVTHTNFVCCSAPVLFLQNDLDGVTRQLQQLREDTAALRRTSAACGTPLPPAPSSSVNKHNTHYSSLNHVSAYVTCLRSQL